MESSIHTQIMRVRMFILAILSDIFFRVLSASYRPHSLMTPCTRAVGDSLCLQRAVLCNMFCYSNCPGGEYLWRQSAWNDRVCHGSPLRAFQRRVVVINGETFVVDDVCFIARRVSEGAWKLALLPFFLFIFVALQCVYQYFATTITLTKGA